MSAITIRHHESTRALDCEDWKALYRETPFTGYAWLHAAEQHSIESLQLQLLLAYVDADLVGAMILETVCNRDRENGIARVVLGGSSLRLSLGGGYFVPNLSAGAPYGYGGHMLFVAGISSDLRVDVAAKLIAAAEDLSERLGARLWFNGVLETDHLLLSSLKASSHLSARYLPLAEMKVTWSSFDEYVYWLKSRSRGAAKDIRRVRNRCRAAGIEFEEPGDVSLLDAKLIDMANQTYRKYSDLAYPFRSGFFTTLQTELGDAFMICVAKSGPDTLGFVTMLADEDTAWADSYGVDFRRRDTAFVYLYLAYHWPIQAAIERGLRRIVLGRGQYELKLRRGCSLVDTYILVKPSGAISRAFHAGLLRAVERCYAKQVPASRQVRPDLAP